MSRAFAGLEAALDRQERLDRRAILAKHEEPARARWLAEIAQARAELAQARETAQALVACAYTIKALTEDYDLKPAYIRAKAILAKLGAAL